MFHTGKRGCVTAWYLAEACVLVFRAQFLAWCRFLHQMSRSDESGIQQRALRISARLY